MPPGAAYCSGCGRAAAGTWVIEPSDDAGPRDREVVIGARRRPRSPLALIALLAVLIAGVIVVSRDHGGSSSPATTTTSVVPATTAPRTSSTTAATTSTTQVVQRLTAGPVLGQMIGLIVYVAVPRDDNEILYALDLDQGVFREIATMSYTQGELPILGDAVVVANDTSQLLVHPEGATKQLGDPATATFSAGRPDAYWKLMYTDDLNPSTAILIVIGAPEQRSVPIPPRFHAFAGDGVGGLLLSGPDNQIYRLPPDGTVPVGLGVSNVLAAANGRLAAVACDAELNCPIEIIELADGSRHSIRGSNRNQGAASLAPDGAHLAQIVNTAGNERQALLVFDTTTGDTLLHVPYDGLSWQSGPPAWSPDSQWLFWNDVSGLEAWNIDRIQPQMIDVPGTDRVSMHVVGVATRR
jgi:hypothetical protein